MNEQLREARDNLEALFAAAPLAIAEFDAAGNVTNINPAAERLYGWSREEVQGRLPLSIPRESPEESLALLQRVLQGESVIGLEIKQQRKDGTLLDGSVSAAPLHDANGRLRGFIGLAEDITRRKEAEEVLRTQAQVLASMGEGVAVTDRRGHILHTNPAFDAMFGYESGELLGRHCNILNCSPPEANLPLHKKILHQINTTGSWSGEFENRQKDGTPFFTQAHISVLEMGGKKLYISVQEDITERRRAQETMRRQAELLDLAHDAILALDPRGRISYWNQGAEALYGWTRGQALGRPAHELLATRFPETLTDIEQQVLEQGHWEGELVHTTRDGRAVTVNSHWTVKRDRGGRVSTILEINQDITAQKEIEKEAHRLASFPLLNPNPILEVDEDGGVIYANPAAQRAAGALKLKAGVHEMVPGDLKEYFARARQGGPREFTLDVKIKEKAYLVNLSFPHDLPTARLYFLDITARQEAEAALRESERRAAFLSELLEKSSQPFAIRGLDGGLEYFNPAYHHMLGYSKKELQDLHLIPKFTAPAWLEHEEAQLQELLRTGQPRRYQKEYLHKDGRTVPAELFVHLRRDEAGKPLSTYAFVTDITERQAAEAALRESEDRYRSLVELSPDAVLVHSGGTYVFANTAAARLFGAATPGELVGQDVLGLVHPDRHDQVRARIQRIYRGETTPLVETEILRLDGRPVDVEAVGTPIAFRGQPAVLLVLRDITLRKEAEAALRESQRQASFLADLIESSSQPFGVGRLDGGIEFFNTAYLHLLGYSREEFQQLDWARELTAPEWRDQEQALLAELLATGQPVRYEKEYFRKDGSRVPVELLVHLRRDEEGQPSLFYAFITDITERKRAEAAIIRAKEEWERTFDAVPDAIFILDREHRVLRMNKAMAEFLAKPPEEVIGHQCHQLMHGRDEAPDFCPQARAMATGEAASALVEEKGRVFDVAVSPIYTPDGTLLGGVHVARDITARHQMQEALRESEERLRLLGDNLPDSAVYQYIHEPDGGTRFLHISAGIEQLNGVSAQDVLNDAQTLHRMILPEYYERLVEAEARSARELADFDMVVQMRRPDGEVRWMQLHSRPRRLPDGRTVWDGVQTDVTARKRTEEALRESEERFRQVVESLPQLGVDRPGRRAPSIYRAGNGWSSLACLRPRA